MAAARVDLAVFRNNEGRLQTPAFSFGVVRGYLATIINNVSVKRPTIPFNR
jgi:hypothetical protein